MALIGDNASMKISITNVPEDHPFTKGILTAHKAWINVYNPSYTKRSQVTAFINAFIGDEAFTVQAFNILTTGEHLLAPESEGMDYDEDIPIQSNAQSTTSILISGICDILLPLFDKGMLSYVMEAIPVGVASKMEPRSPFYTACTIESYSTGDVHIQIMRKAHADKVTLTKEQLDTIGAMATMISIKQVADFWDRLN